MKPYYDHAGITIYHGRAEDVLPTLEAVDLVLTDPPTGETSLSWDKPVPGWPDLVLPLIKATGSLWCFGSMRYFLTCGYDFGSYRFAQDLVWEKHNGSIFHADRFRRIHEHIVQWYPRRNAWQDVYKSPVYTADAIKRAVRKKVRPAHTGQISQTPYVSVDGGPRLQRSILRVPSCHGYAEHPTQKPLGAVIPILEYSLPPDGIVLDLFSGSGTTLRAAKDLGRRAIGIEVLEEYCAVAANRLSQEVLL